MSTRIHAVQESDEVRTSLVRGVVGHVMTITGDVDAFTQSSFESFLMEAAERQDVTALDLSGVEFFGVAGVDTLRDFARGFDGSISISDAVDRVMAIYGIELS